MLSQSIKKIVLIIVIMIGACSISSAASLHCWVKVNGSWVYGTILSDKDISVSVKNGTATVQPPWAFVGDDGKTVLSSPDKPTTLEISITDPNGQKKSNYNLTISDIVGVSINSSEQISITIYDIEKGTFVFQKEKAEIINILPDYELQRNKLYVMVIIDKTGYQESFKFAIGNELK